MNTTHRNTVLGLCVAALVAACSSAPRQVEELESARVAVQQVQASPEAGRFAAAEISAANDALREADRLAQQKKSADAVRQAAYVAQRHADIAAQQIARGRAEQMTAEAEAERQRVQLQAREREAAAARAQAEQAAEAARREAALLQSQIAELQARQTDRGLVLTLGDVLFDTGQAALKPGAMSTVDRLATFLKEQPERSVVIEGHTDSVGSDALNMTLSDNRANAVKAALMQRGVDAQRIVAVGKGKSMPIASNDDAAGRQRNRRVEIIISNPR